ncbi:MAG: ferrous iron transporter B, partial [Oscillospiraceae bacterium]|nr:ferrous iron transporter B [Oscillospiraceae bacterium]
NVLRTMLDRGLAFIKKATSIVMISTVLIWFLQSFNWHFEMVDAEESMLAGIGSLIAPLFAPLGFGDWKAAVASLTGLIAKENLVGTFGVLYGFEEVAEDGAEFWPELAAAYTPVAAYAMMAFNLLCVPCFAAVGALRREMMSDKMTWFAVFYQCALAYIVSLMIYQFGTLFTTGPFGIGTVFAIVCLVFVIYLLFIKKAYSPEKKSKLSLERA